MLSTSRPVAPLTVTTTEMVQLPSPLRVFISGGTSGIGRALAERFAAHSGTEHVYVAGRRQAELDSLASAHSNVTGLKLDVADLESLPAFVKDLVGKGINFFVINAGMQRGFDFSEVCDSRTPHQQLDADMLAAARLGGSQDTRPGDARQLHLCKPTQRSVRAVLIMVRSLCTSSGPCCESCLLIDR